MSRVPHPCATCGKPCWGKRCRSCGWAKARPQSRACAECGAEFTPTDDKARLCSRKCIGKSVGRKLQTTPRRVCDVCGAEFVRRPTGTGKRPRFCSRLCADEARRSGLVKTGQRPTQPKPQKSPRSRIYAKTCKVCGNAFCGRNARSAFCSAQCKIDDAGFRVKGLYAAATQFIDGRYVGAQWRRTLLQYLVDRDGDRCGICGRRVDITLKSGTRGSRRGPSVDHIVPRSLGGSDDLENLRLTHWGCNQKRSNRGGGEQLALVG